MCGCEDHDRLFARWTGIWPGLAESQYLDMDMNTFHQKALHKILFVKPKEK